jgi:DNA helicase-2/ATP-dependent DNA helicase PcrA
VRDSIGLGSAMTLLDSSGGATGSHLDDLEALLQVADLHPDATTFADWLRAAFHGERVEGGVTLSTIHRVKGREWDHVAVFGVTDGIVPHRLADDVEEERRVLHVAITRGRSRVVVLGDADRASPFLAELDCSAPHERRLRLVDPPAAARAVKPVAKAPDARPATVGLEVGVLGGYEGVVDAVEEDGARVALGDGGSLFVRFGERVRVDGQHVVLGRPRAPHADAASTALRAWRLERSRADGVPAFVVLSDKHLDGIAAASPATLAALRLCPGIGPAKLEAYGDDILAVLASTAEAAASQ